MKKILTLAVLTQLITACGNHDPLNTIKNAKIEGYNSTWGESADKLSACKSGTQQWKKVEDSTRRGREVVLFECEATEQAIAPYIARQEENATAQQTQPSPQATSAKLRLNISHSAEGKGKEYEAYLGIALTFADNSTKKLAITGIKEVGKVIAENQNPIEKILPDPLTKHKIYSSQSIFQ